MNALDRLTQHLEAYEQAPESAGLHLRIDLAELIVRGLERKGWTQRQLAQAAGMKESRITRLIHSDANATFDVAGRVLRALGIRASLKEKRVRVHTGLAATTITPQFKPHEETDGHISAAIARSRTVVTHRTHAGSYFAAKPGHSEYETSGGPLSEINLGGLNDPECAPRHSDRYASV